MYRSFMIVFLNGTYRFACFVSSDMFVVGYQREDSKRHERILSSMNENSKPSINSSLRQERLLRGWSQQALADQLGTTIVTVSRWERGIQSPGPMMRLKLSRLFEKNESELGLFPEESVASPSPQNSQDTAISTPGTEPTTDEAPEEVTPEEPAGLTAGAGLTPSRGTPPQAGVKPAPTVHPDVDAEKQAPAHKFLAHESQ